MASVYERWVFNPLMDRLFNCMPQVLGLRQRVLEGTDLPSGLPDDACGSGARGGAGEGKEGTAEPAEGEVVVVEVGAGTGLNFPHYPSGLKKLFTLQPYPADLVPAVAHQRAKDRACGALELDNREYLTEAQAVAQGILQPRAEDDLRPANDYRFPFAEGSVDHLVCTFCLCTIPDHGGFLEEVRRVLKPNGSYRFIEHIDPQLQSDASGKHGTATWRSWRALHKRLACGCDIGNNTQESLKAARWFDLATANIYGEEWPRHDPSREWWMGKLIYGVVNKRDATPDDADSASPGTQATESSGDAPTAN